MIAKPPPASFKQTQILYYALFAGQAMIGLILFYLMQDNPQDREVVPPFSFIIPGAVLFGIAAAYFIGQKRQSDIPVNGIVQEKLEHFKSSSILKYALAEGGNLISLLLTFTMANSNYMIWFVIGLAVFILLRPKRDQFIEDIRPGEEFE